MTLLKWVLVIAGVLFLAGTAAVVGIVYWASGIEAVHVTEADLAVGGNFPPDERAALISACEKRNVSKGPDACACIADRAASELSRFSRLIFTAGLDGSASTIVGLTKGLMQSGVPQQKVEAAEKDSEARFKAIMQACGLKP